MNTASRMESTGLPGRIHLSEHTANLIRKHGRDDWLTERPDCVEAKGKGIMTTYFMVVGREASTATFSTAAGTESTGVTKPAFPGSQEWEV